MRLLVLLFSALLCAPAFGADPAQPNVIFILADDFGFADLASYGHPLARTPNLDRLASEGTRFGQFYATGVTCCPARTGLMTSRWPASFPVYPANGGFADRVTVTEILKKHGYATGHFGKWHIGPEQKPGTYGIDVIGDEHEAGRRKRDAARGRDAHIYDAAIRFVEEHRNGPFYVNIWSHISHHPVNPPAAYVEKLKDLVLDESKFSEGMRAKFARCKAQGGDSADHLRRYLADILSMDEDIGRLLKRLDELGLRDNTIVVFSSDQGPADIRENAGEEDPKPKRREKRSAGPSAEERLALRLSAMGNTGELRGGKHGMNEGGVRVPFIVRWPARVPAGKVDEKSVLSGVDWLPTICSLAGVKFDPGQFEGEDVSAAWLGKQEHVRTKPLLWKTSAPGSPASIRDGQWKLLQPARRRGEPELYDIAADPGEKQNLAAQKPEVVKRLAAKVEGWVATLPKEYVKSGDEED